MDSILQSIEDWFRELLVSGIMNNMKEYQTAKYNIDRFLEREAVDQERDHQKERKREEPVL